MKTRRTKLRFRIRFLSINRIYLKSDGNYFCLQLHTTEFNTNCALHELYTYAMKYNEQLMVTLEEDEFSQKQRLAYKLEQVHNIMAADVQPWYWPDLTRPTAPPMSPTTVPRPSAPQELACWWVEVAWAYISIRLFICVVGSLFNCSVSGSVRTQWL